MRILLIVHSLRRGGAECIVLEIARGLLARGHLVKIVALLAVNEFPNSTNGLDVETLLAVEDYRWPGSVPILARRLVAAAKRFKPDATQVHTPTAAVVAAYSGLQNVMHVLHGYGVLDRPTSAKAWIARRVNRWAARRLGGKVATVAPSMREAAAKHLGLSAAAIKCIPNGIDLSRFPFVQRSPRDEPQILMVGTLAWVKHTELGIEGLTLLAEQIPGACLRIVGDGPLRGDLERHVKDLGICGRVEFLGRREDVPGLMAEADLFWHLSESEGLPLVIAEAMASGLPVVGHNVRGVRDVVEDGVCGFLVAFGDQPSLLSQTARLLRNPALYSAFARSGRQRVEENFSVDRMVNEHEAVLAELAREL